MEMIDTVWATVPDVARATTIAEGVRALQTIGGHIDLPVVGFKDDISSLQTPRIEDGTPLADILGWPMEFVDEWEKSSSTFYSGLFRHCRFRILPFPWAADETTPGPLQSRKIRKGFTTQGYHAALVVPVHCPRGRIATVSWWGIAGQGEILERIDIHGPALLAAANYFTALYMARTAPDAPDDVQALSEREVRCLGMAANGLSDTEIARGLDISFHTVRFYIVNAVKKLGARNRTHCVALAAQLGLIGPVDSELPDNEDDLPFTG